MINFYNDLGYSSIIIDIKVLKKYFHIQSNTQTVIRKKKQVLAAITNIQDAVFRSTLEISQLTHKDCAMYFCTLFITALNCHT